MFWAAGRGAGTPDTWTYDHIRFHDLLDNAGNLLGYVREDKRPGHGFTPYTAHAAGRAQFPTQSTLKDAKALLLTYFVTEILEDT